MLPVLSMRALTSCWIMILFLISGALPGHVLPVQSHAEVAAEPEPASFDREDESMRSSASRKLRNRGRKAKPRLTPDLASTAPLDLMLLRRVSPRHFPSAEYSRQPLHRLHHVFRI